MMKEQQALTSFAAISQETRLRIVRLLVVAGADGLAAGAIAEKLGSAGAAAPRISFHLNQLEQAGLIQSRRNGRFIVYSAVFSTLSDLVAFLMHDCCHGHCQYCDKAISLFALCEGRSTEDVDVVVTDASHTEVL